MIWSTIIRRPKFIVGSAVIGLLCIATFGAPWLSSKDPNAQNMQRAVRLSKPTLTHLCGTDQFGRDVFSRMLFGGRISIFVAISVVALSVLLGTLIGAISGYMGGHLDTILMRMADLFLAFPLIFLVATCIVLFGNSLFWLILVLALTGWMDVARLVRAEVLSLKNRPFILKAHATGLTQRRVIAFHLVPNMITTILVVAVLRMADIILIESALSFLGLGVQPPQASWGAILGDGRMYLPSAWWLSFFPALAILLSTFGFYLMGEGFQVLDE